MTFARVAERILENKEAQSEEVRPTEAVPHFLGAIVLDQKMVPTGLISESQVIDGQQRLTTLQLLLDAAHGLVAMLRAAGSQTRRSPVNQG